MATPNDTWDKIAAFADGELDGEQCCELLREAMAEPQQAKCVEYQQQLRKLLAGCMDCQKTMRCPDELKDCIDGLADEHCVDCPDTAAPTAEPSGAATPAAVPPTTADAGAPVLARIGTWVPLAAAAALFVAALGVFFAASQNDGPANAGDGQVVVAAPFSAQLVRNVETRHVRCASGLSAPLQADRFPKQVEALGDVVVERLGPAATGLPLDLSSVGYDYRLAGLCTAPGTGAVHVIYAGPADELTGQRPMLSLWIKAYDPAADPDIEPGQKYNAVEGSVAHPTLVWRDESLIFFLVGDAPRQVEQAQQVLALRS